MTRLEQASCGDDCCSRFEPTVNSARPMELLSLLSASAMACSATLSEMYSGDKRRSVTNARRVYVMLARLLTTRTFLEIAAGLNRDSHSMVISCWDRGRAALAVGNGESLALEALLTDAAHLAIRGTDNPAMYTAIWDRRFGELKREVSNG